MQGTVKSNGDASVFFFFNEIEAFIYTRALEGAV